MGEEPGQDKDLGAPAPQSLSVGQHESLWISVTSETYEQLCLIAQHLECDVPEALDAVLRVFSPHNDDCGAVVSEKGS